MVPIVGNHVHAFHTIWPSYLLAYMQPYPLQKIWKTIFRKWGGWVKGCLEFFRKLIRFGSATLPLYITRKNSFSHKKYLPIFRSGLYAFSHPLNLFTSSLHVSLSFALDFLTSNYIWNLNSFFSLAFKANPSSSGGELTVQCNEWRIFSGKDIRQNKQKVKVSCNTSVASYSNFLNQKRCTSMTIGENVSGSYLRQNGSPLLAGS